MTKRSIYFEIWSNIMIRSILILNFLILSSILNCQTIEKFYNYFCLEDTMLYEGQELKIPQLSINMQNPTIMKHYCILFNPVLPFLYEYPNSRIEIRIYNAWNSIFDGTPYENKDYFIAQNIADSIKIYLVNNGISPDRVEATGYALEFPVIANLGVAERSEYIEVGDTLNLAKLNSVLNYIDKKYTNSKGKRIHKRNYEYDQMNIRSIIYTANEREEIKILRL